MKISDEQNQDWDKAWSDRQTALVSVLGDNDGQVLHAVVPFELGGQADVICFRNHIAGRVAATCELLGEPGQIQNGLGTYELMIAHRDETDWGPNVISRLARYTCDARLEPGHTMEIGGVVPKGSTIAGFLFLEYARFQYRSCEAGLLLCLGITSDELAQCKRGRSKEVLAALKAAGVFPYTDLSRRSVL